MAEPAPTTPSSPAPAAPSPSAAPAAPAPSANSSPPNPAPSPSPAPTTPPARPDWLPENFFDAKAGPKWDDFGKHFAEVATRDAAEQVRRQTLPAKPEDYKVATSASFKPPEGVEFKIDENNPLWAQARSWAQKSGLTQDQFHEAIDLFAGSQVADAATIKAARDGEVAKLGANGTARVTAVNQFLDAAGVGGLKERLFTAADVQAMEKLAAKFSSQGAASFSGAHRDPAGGSQARPTEEQWAKMSAAERLDYTRSPAAQALRARAN